jgi:membrane protease YdiL (CAAX protease family)
MPNKTASIISAILTVILLIVTGLVILFAQLLALNGFSERVGTISLVTSLVCQGAAVILAALLAGRLTRWFIEKFNWNKTLAMIIAVIAASIPGALLMAFGLLISIFVAEGIR